MIFDTIYAQDNTNSNVSTNSNNQTLSEERVEKLREIMKELYEKTKEAKDLTDQIEKLREFILNDPCDCNKTKSIEEQSKTIEITPEYLPNQTDSKYQNTDNTNTQTQTLDEEKLEELIQDIIEKVQQKTKDKLVSYAEEKITEFIIQDYCGCQPVKTPPTPELPENDLLLFYGGVLGSITISLIFAFMVVFDIKIIKFKPDYKRKPQINWVSELDKVTKTTTRSMYTTNKNNQKEELGK
jgi:hypothetical protein